MRSDYSIDSVVITNVNGAEYEIKDLVIGVDIYESLSSPYIKCELAIADAANMTTDVVGGVEIYKDEVLTITVRIVYKISCLT